MSPRILVDITHPAHFHFFRPAIGIWRERGHEVFVVARDKDMTLQLLQAAGYPFICLSKARRGTLGLGIELVEHQTRLLRLILRLHPDVLLEVAGTFIVHAGFVARTPSLVFYDTEHARLSNAITYPFATKVITPECYKGDLGRKHVRYRGYQELAYLHPRYFRPDLAALVEAGLGADEPFFLVRFVSWGASHDIGHSGFSLQGKRELVERLSRLGRVVITSESRLPPEFEPYRMPVSPTRIHDLLYYSSLYIGEGGTMASEAAILGTPAIYVNSLTLGYLEELEGEFGLVHRIVNEQEAIKCATELATDRRIKEEYRRRSWRMLQDKIDVTEFVVEAVQSYVS